MKKRLTIFQNKTTDYLYGMSRVLFVRLMVISAIAGALIWVLALLLDRMILSQVFCNGGIEGILMCINSKMNSGYIALVLVSVMMVPMLVMANVRRPLLVVIAATCSLWGITVWTSGTWLVSLLYTVVAVMAVYAALLWLNRIRGNIAAIFFMVMFVALARFVLAL